MSPADRLEYFERLVTVFAPSVEKWGDSILYYFPKPIGTVEGRAKTSARAQYMVRRGTFQVLKRIVKQNSYFNDHPKVVETINKL